MNILITAPSLNPEKNVSGVSTVAGTIIKYNHAHHFFHYLLGRPDEQLTQLNWFIQLVKQILLFPIRVRKQKIDLVHQNLPFDPKGLIRESVINFWCWVFNIPVVLHIHGGKFITQGTDNIFFLKLAQSLFVHSKQVIVLSELEKVLLNDKFNFQSARVLSNSINTTAYQNQRLKTYTDKPTVLFLGRIEENKGIYEIIEAFKMLVKGSNFRFVLCGDGPLKDYCIETFGTILGGDFEYKGVISGQNKIDTIKEADFFILPSYFEGLPMALLETMAAGVVPIVTNVGSMKQVVEHGMNGLLVEKKNSKDLYEKLKTIFTNQALCHQLSENAKNTVSEHYDIKNYIDQLNDIYTGINIK